MSTDAKNLGISIIVDGLNLNIKSTKAEDEGNYLIKLMVYNQNYPSYAPQPIEVSLQLKHIQ